MDSTAASLCRDNNTMIHVFGIAEEGNVMKAVCGENRHYHYIEAMQRNIAQGRIT